MNKFIYRISCLLLCLSAVAFSACSDDEDEDVKYPDVTMKAGDTYTIENGTNWLSADPLIATVSGNTIQALRVGKTTISNNSAKFKLTVTPKYNLYDDPCMQWGASTSTVNSFMKGYTMLQQDENIVYYSGNGVAEMYAYYFEKGKLSLSCVFLDADKYYSTLHSFLAERYEFLSQDDEDYTLYYISMDKELAIMVELFDISGTIYAEVVYFPYEGEATNMKSHKQRLRSISPMMGSKANVANLTLPKF